MKNKKGLLKSVLVASLILTTGLSAIASEVEEPIKGELSFTDLEEGKWYTESMVDLAEKNILKGFNGEIKPNANITRAEYIQILDNIIGFEKTIDLEDTPDLKESDWFFESVRAAIAQGVVRDNEDMALRPRELLTREEMFVMTVRAFDLKDLKNPVKKDYTKEYKDGKDVSQWSKEAINILLDKKLIKGNEEKKLLAKENITRAEASMLISAMEKVKDLEATKSVVFKSREKQVSPNFSGKGPIFPAEYYPPDYPTNLPDGLTLKFKEKDRIINDFGLPDFPKEYTLFSNGYNVSGQKLSGKGSINTVAISYTIDDENTRGYIVYMVGNDSLGDSFFYTYLIESGRRSYDWRKPAFSDDDFEAVDDFALSFLEAFIPYLEKLESV